MDFHDLPIDVKSHLMFLLDSKLRFAVVIALAISTVA